MFFDQRGITESFVSEYLRREHGIEVDEKGFVWVGGNADNDNAILKFTLKPKSIGAT